ncbi:hypothetical protein Pan44_23550 [Caulifigura coniformis]|uniref:Uncharacterized protein n=2 Tax=Caulifigura coniformis TaxID=2527983 RepID=A0A517SDX2_9PLAN|nr:hypothetical protein Pan44_23550 [Caulifigura coniformis]
MCQAGSYRTLQRVVLHCLCGFVGVFGLSLGVAGAAADDEQSPGRQVVAQALQPATPPPTPAARPATSPPLNPASGPPAAPRAPLTMNSAELRQRLARTRMARSPEMFGDQFLSSPLLLNGGTNPLTTFATIGTLSAPSSLHAFSQKVSENNHPLPRDRVFYSFNAFDDALKFDSSFDGALFPASRSQTLLRHTVGIEKTFNEGESSIEFRLPFFDGTTYGRTVGAESLAYDGGNVGNLLVTAKTLLYESDAFAMSAGLGVAAPTGSDATIRVNSTLAKIDNSAVYLSPFLASLWTPSDEWFVMGFSQIQVSANGDPVVLRDPLLGNSRVATVNAPTALSLDLSIGRWLFRDRTDAIIQGMALVGEVHQFAALQDTDGVPQADPTDVGLRAADERLSLTTLTFGVHSVLPGNSTLRVAGVVPMDDDQFDGELIVQFNFYY